MLRPRSLYVQWQIWQNEVWLNVLSFSWLPFTSLILLTKQENIACLEDECRIKDILVWITPARLTFWSFPLLLLHCLVDNERTVHLAISAGSFQRNCRFCMKQVDLERLLQCHHAAGVEWCLWMDFLAKKMYFSCKSHLGSRKLKTICVLLIFLNHFNISLLLKG